MEIITVVPKKESDISVAWLHPDLHFEDRVFYKLADAYPDQRTISSDIIKCDRLVIPDQNISGYDLVSADELPNTIRVVQPYLASTPIMRFRYDQWNSMIESMLKAPGLRVSKTQEAQFTGQMCAVLGGILHHRPELIEHPSMIAPYSHDLNGYAGYAFGTVKIGDRWITRCYGSEITAHTIEDQDTFIKHMIERFVEPYSKVENPQRVIVLTLAIMKHILELVELPVDELPEWREYMDEVMMPLVHLTQQHVRSLAPHLVSEVNEEGTRSALVRTRSLFCLLDLCETHHMARAKQTGIRRDDTRWDPKHQLHRAALNNHTWVYYLNCQPT